MSWQTYLSLRFTGTTFSEFYTYSLIFCRNILLMSFTFSSFISSFLLIFSYIISLFVNNTSSIVSSLYIITFLVFSISYSFSLIFHFFKSRLHLHLCFMSQSFWKYVCLFSSILETYFRSSFKSLTFPISDYKNCLTCNYFQGKKFVVLSIEKEIAVSWLSLHKHYFCFCFLFLLPSLSNIQVTVVNFYSIFELILNCFRYSTSSFPHYPENFPVSIYISSA